MLDAIRQGVINIEYGLNFKTTIILLPGISWGAQKWKIDQLIDQLAMSIQVDKDVNEAAKITKKIDKVYAWHYLGSMVQVIAFAVLFKVMSPLFIAPLILVALQNISAMRGISQDRSTLINEDYAEVGR